MPKNDNAHALRLNDAIRDIAGGQDAAAYGALHPLGKSASPARKEQWAREICGALEDTYGEETARCIRRACRCGDGKSMAEEIRRCIDRSPSLAEACAMFTRQNPYAFLQYVGEREVIFGYHSCVCACVKHAKEPVPRLWCECSAGYAEAMLSQVFGPVRAELLESVVSGGARCAMRIRL